MSKHNPLKPPVTISISQVFRLRILVNSSLNSTKLTYVEGISRRGPQVWAIGLVLKPLYLINVTCIFLPTRISIPVVNCKKVDSFDMSRPLINRCKNLNASLSPLFTGFEMRQDNAFFVVGLRVSYKASMFETAGIGGTVLTALEKVVKTQS